MPAAGGLDRWRLRWNWGGMRCARQPTKQRQGRDETRTNDTATVYLPRSLYPGLSVEGSFRMITMPLHLGVRIMTNNSYV